MTEEPYDLSLSKVAQRLQVSSHTAKKILEECGVVGFRVTSRIRYRQSDIDQVFTSRLTKTGDLPTNPKGKETE